MSTRLRSFLFAPAVRAELVRKMPGTGCDAMVIDCEDATPLAAKTEGRAAARTLAAELADAGPAVYVRVNAVATEFFAADVADGLVPTLAGVVVPKLESVEGVEAVAAALDEIGLERLGIVAGIETALGVADARSVLAHPRIGGAYFGAEDFIADMGGVRTETNNEVAHARAVVALAGRLAGVPTLDQIVSDFRDAERFEREAAEARALGFAGKLCIHPSQVATANRAFVPSADELDRARRLLAAFDEAVTAGHGAASFEGQMVDEPLAAQARNLLARAEP